MKLFISALSIRFKCAIQYRTAAYAGIATQFFFGFMMIYVYKAFYSSSAVNASNIGMTYSKIVTYTWLNQAFLALINFWAYDKDIVNLIHSGDIAYELVRPQKLFRMWGAKMIGTKLVATLLRAVPIILLTIFLPIDYRLSPPENLTSFLLFALALFMGMLLIVTMYLLLCTMAFYFISITSLIIVFMSVGSLCSGLEIPLAILPEGIKNVLYLLPFAYVSDFPFQIYTSNLTSFEIIRGFAVQGFWLLVIYLIATILLKNGLRRTVAQGG